MARQRRKEKNCPINDTRNYKRKKHRYLQLEKSWNMERVCRTIMRFTGENEMKHNLDHGNYDFEKNDYRPTNFQNIRKIRGK